MSNDNINLDYEEVNSQILDELRQINENLNGLYELLHGLILPFRTTTPRRSRALGAIKDHTLTASRQEHLAHPSDLIIADTGPHLI